MEYDNRNKFVLYKNQYKKSEAQPDYRGNMTLPDGTKKDIAAWLRTSSKDGSKFMSGKISDPYKKPNPQEVYEDNEADIPF